MYQEMELHFSRDSFQVALKYNTEGEVPYNISIAKRRKVALLPFFQRQSMIIVTDSVLF